MKSEKAKQELEDGSWKVEVGYEGEDVDSPYHAVRVDVAQYAVELAEQEAEERMREKAIEAFCDECACFEACICCLPAGACDRKNNFIQKLTKK
jgi:hypothetical protein